MYIINHERNLRMHKKLQDIKSREENMQKSSWKEKIRALLEKKKWDVKDWHRALKTEQWQLEQLLLADISSMDEGDLEKIYEMTKSAKLDKKLMRFEHPVMIAVWAHKGGTGKSTTATNLSYELSQMGYNVLAIDTDSQSDMTSVLYPQYLDDPEKSFYEAFSFCDDFQDTEYICRTEYPNLDIVAGSAKCEGLENVLGAYDEKHRDRMWERCLRGVRKANYYDFIIVDMDKTAGMMNRAILMESDYVISPIEPAMFAMKAVPPIITQVEEVAKTNQKLKLLGILYNKVDLRKKKAVTENMELVNGFAPDIAFKTYIKNDSNVENSQKEHMPLGYYNKSSAAGKQMIEFTQEMLERIRKHREEIANAEKEG